VISGLAALTLRQLFKPFPVHVLAFGKHKHVQMKWSDFFTSSVGKKFVMALSGLFLISFLIVHVGINACIFADILDDNDNGEMFNKAAHFMGSSYVIRLLEFGLFVVFFIHIIQGYVLEAKNRSKRGVGYQVSMGSKGSAWYRKSMGLLGTLILLFLIVHISQFWVPSRITGNLPQAHYNNNGIEYHNMYIRMIEVFQSGWIVALYLLGCFSLAWHLVHGFQSAFRTMGVSNTRYVTMARVSGIAFSILVSLLFALMPISMHLGWVD
jgi:succinate dehydrogenase / fumarate reductase cytochrome b subunit